MSGTSGETSAAQHEARAAQEIPSVRVAVVTVSDTRTEETDTSGRLLREMLEADGHTVVFSRIVKDDGRADPSCAERRDWRPELRRDHLQRRHRHRPAGHDLRCHRPELEKRLVGFGEIFRHLSYEEIGPAAIMSRATAGTYRTRIVISIPGSTAAVRLALEKLIRPQLPHMVWELVRQ